MSYPQAIPVSVLDARARELQARQDQLREDLRAIEFELQLLAHLREQAVPVSSESNGEKTSLTQAIRVSIAANPGFNSGQIVDLLESHGWKDRSEAKDFRKMVQTVIGQLLQNERTRFMRDEGGRLFARA